MTEGFQPRALAAAVKPGFSSEQAAAEQVRNGTLMPFFGACGSAAVAGIGAGSVISEETAALAAATPPLDEEAPEGAAGVELFADVDDEPQADAVTMHAAATTPIHALCSFILGPAFEVGTGRRARFPARGRGQFDERRITRLRTARQDFPHHDYDGHHDYEIHGSTRAPPAQACGRRRPRVMGTRSVPLDELVEAPRPVPGVLLHELGKVIAHQAPGLRRLPGNDGAGDAAVLLVNPFPGC